MIEANEKCTGCMACRFACPKAAISMEEDIEGFLQPKVNSNLCVECGICTKVCPKEKPIDYDHSFSQRYFAARMVNRKERLETQSGGVCTVFSQKAIESNKGVVYGVGFDSEWNAIHKRATTTKGIEEFKGSKYVQSNIEQVYDSIIADIKNKGIEQIVVTGTACQIAGIKSFLKIKKQPLDKIVFIDIICHGVPSPKVWRDHLKIDVKREGLKNVKFRNKRFGWSSHTETYYYKNSFSHGKCYTHFFYMEVISRKCCNSCIYASYNRESDITVADFWGYKKAGLSYDSFGISECLINTPKGEAFFDRCKDSLEVSEITREQADQWNLNQPTVVDPVKRAEFWSLYHKDGYKAVRDAYCKEEIKNQWKINVFYILKAIKRFILDR